MDFLGLATLTVMQRACALIRERHGMDLNLDYIPTDDPAIFELLGRGEAAGVFQVEGSGMRRYLMEMKPTAAGPRHRDDRALPPRPDRIHPALHPAHARRGAGANTATRRSSRSCARRTGSSIYQEQLMRAAIDMAGYTPSEADDLRKAVSKKNAEALKTHRAKFIAGAGKVRSIPADLAAAIFDDWEGFARYGFNKAHAADYGVICAQTAYLKAHYPVEFMTALLSVSKNEIEKVALYIADCRRMGIDVLPPDVNRSGWDFSIEEKPEGGYAIRYGLGAVKNVGEGPVNEFLREREHGGAFSSLDDLAARVDLRRVGKRALEVAREGGRAGRLGRTRGRAGHARPDPLRFRRATSARKEAGQISLFSAAPGGADGNDHARRRRARCPSGRCSTGRRNCSGLYVSDHPLSAYLEQLQNVVTHYSAELTEAVNGAHGEGGRDGHARPSVPDPAGQGDGLCHARGPAGLDRDHPLPVGVGEGQSVVKDDAVVAGGRQGRDRHRHAAGAGGIDHRRF